jgi:hypothetical protein
MRALLDSVKVRHGLLRLLLPGIAACSAEIQRTDRIVDLAFISGASVGIWR